MDRVEDGVDGNTPYAVMTTRAPAVLINVPCKLQAPLLLFKKATDGHHCWKALLIIKPPKLHCHLVMSVHSLKA